METTTFAYPRLGVAANRYELVFENRDSNNIIKIIVELLPTSTLFLLFSFVNLNLSFIKFDFWNCGQKLNNIENGNWATRFWKNQRITIVIVEENGASEIILISSVARFFFLSFKEVVFKIIYWKKLLNKQWKMEKRNIKALDLHKFINTKPAHNSGYKKWRILL